MFQVIQLLKLFVSFSKMLSLIQQIINIQQFISISCLPYAKQNKR